MNATAIIRQRGQLTIPGKIRSDLSWMQTNSTISIRKTVDEKVILEPLQKTQIINWKSLRSQLKRVSNYKGKRGNLSQFIIEDRERH